GGHAANGRVRSAPYIDTNPVVCEPAGPGGIGPDEIAHDPRAAAGAVMVDPSEGVATDYITGVVHTVEGAVGRVVSTDDRPAGAGAKLDAELVGNRRRAPGVRSNQVPLDQVVIGPVVADI